MKLIVSDRPSFRPGKLRLKEVAIVFGPPGASLADLLAMSTPWQRRLIYEELFLVQLAVLRRKAIAQEEPGVAVDLSRLPLEEAEILFDLRLDNSLERTP